MLASLNQIAIVAASPPGQTGVGQHYMSELVSTLNGSSLHVVALLKHESEWCDEDRAELDSTTVLPRRYEFAKRVGPPWLNQRVANAAFQIKTLRYAKQLSVQIEHYVGQNSCDRVLLVMESPLTFLIAAQLTKSSAFSSTLLVWDHPDHVLSSFGHSGYRRRVLRQAFDGAVAAADNAITVAPALAQLVQSMNAGLDIRLFRCPAKPVDAVRPGGERLPAAGATDRPFVIGFAGSVTAPDELEFLQTTLDTMNWKVGDRPIILRLFGMRFTVSAMAARRIEYCGFLRNQTDLLNQLSDCDLCFLPQPFAPEKRLIAEYSFPTKLSTYLDAGCPVLLLAPPNASLSRYREGHVNRSDWCSDLGFQVDQLDPIQLRRLLEELGRAPDQMRAARFRLGKCIRSEFSADEGSKNVRSAMGLN